MSWIDRYYWLIMGALFSICVPCVAQERPVNAQYFFSLETSSSPVKEGRIWIYHYSWYGLEKFCLAEIKNGHAAISLSSEKLVSEIQPHPDTEAYILVLETGSSKWYRTPNILPRNLLKDFVSELNNLGRVGKASDLEINLILPAPFVHNISLKDIDGQPIVNTTLPVSIYVYDRNHCHVHYGIDLGQFTTNADGEIHVTAPLVPLYLGLRYRVPDGKGFAGQMYCDKYGIKVSKWPRNEVKVVVNLPKNTLHFKVTDHDENPLEKVKLEHCLRVGSCGGANCGSLWESDKNGDIFINEVLQTTQGFNLIPPSGEKYPLSKDELAALKSNGMIQVKLP